MTPVLIVHVGAGSIAALSGAVALSARKGARLHRAAGTVFFVAMLTMAASAAYLSALMQPGTFFGSIFTFYLVATAWMTVRRQEGSTGAFEEVAFCVALACAAGETYFGWRASHSPTGQFLGYSSAIYDFLAVFVALAAAADLKVILLRGISGAPRIARHLWRMCFAFFFSAASALTQLQKILPGSVFGFPVLYALLALAIAPLLLLIFWLIRVRFSNWYELDAPTVQHV